MSGATFKTDLLMFGDLLAYLRQHGFQIGVDHYLRLQHLLDKVGDGCAPRELRTILCPIFATSKSQQEQFYRAFDSYFDLFQLPEELPEEASSLADSSPARALDSGPKRPRRKWLYAVGTVALASLIFALVLLLRPKTAEQSSQNQAKTEANTNAAPEESANAPTPLASPDTAVVTANETPARANEAQTSTPTPQPTPQPSPEPGFYERYRSWVNAAIILSPLLLFLLFEWYRFARRKLLLQKQSSRKPPFVWPVRVDPPEEGLYDSEQFLAAARLLRRRQVDEFRRLDVEATVAATIERLGFPVFRYRSDSRVPEYLILIERASYKDHQARLFDELGQALEREGVFVARYFFDGDPRVCRDESGAVAVQLTELQNKFSAHRLLVFGSGDRLLDQLSGRLDGWTAIFNHWQDRALLTVEPPAQWGLREIALAQLFIVLPATLNGLVALVDYFETTVPEDLRAWARGGGASPALGASPEETVRALRRDLGEDLFQWLAACAVYTELQWNLTLFIGSLPAMPPGLVTEENLLKLIRLPWFRVGVIPDEVRWLLINELAPERQRAVRTALVELLEKDPAPLETFASDQYRLNLFTQRWLQSRTRKRLRELIQLMKQLPRGQVVRDLTLIRFLESSKRSPLDFLLPDRLRKVFYYRGIPAFGLKTGARLLVALVFIGVAWIGIKALSPPAPLNLPEEMTENFGNPQDIPSGQLPASVPSPEPTTVNGSTNRPPVETPRQPPTQTTNTGTWVSEVPAATADANVQPSPSPSIPSPPAARSSNESAPITTVTGRPGPGEPGVFTIPPQGELPPEAPPPMQTPTPQSKPGATETANLVAAKPVNHPKPRYPPEARDARVFGNVTVQVVIDESGKVISARATSGHPLLQKAAVEAAYKARYQPALSSGKPVQSSATIIYNFPKLPDQPQPDDMQNRPDQRPAGRQPPPGGRHP